MKKLFIISLFVLLLIPNFNGLKAVTYTEGDLIALEGQESAAVYYIGDDGKKYIFPDSKTYFTWYENFDDVHKVGIDILDQYPDGGVVPYRGGVRLITHQNTAKIYAVEPGGIIRWVKNENIAVNLYGPNWGEFVQDVIPGFFSSSYTVGEDLSTKLPTGTVVKEINSGNYFYIEDGCKKRLLGNSLKDNNINEDNVLEVEDLVGYLEGLDVLGSEDRLKQVNYRYRYGITEEEDGITEEEDGITEEEDGITEEEDGITEEQYSSYQFTYEKHYRLDGLNNFDEIYIKNTNPTTRDVEVRQIKIYIAEPTSNDVLVKESEESGTHWRAVPQGGNSLEYIYNGSLDLSSGGINIKASNVDVESFLSDWIIWDRTENKQVKVLEVPSVKFSAIVPNPEPDWSGTNDSYVSTFTDTSYNHIEIKEFQDLEINWEALNADSCVASSNFNLWSGNKELLGSDTIIYNFDAFDAESNFFNYLYLDCENSFGTTSLELPIWVHDGGLDIKFLERRYLDIGSRELGILAAFPSYHIENLELTITTENIDNNFNVFIEGEEDVQECSSDGCVLTFHPENITEDSGNEVKIMYDIPETEEIIDFVDKICVELSDVDTIQGEVNTYGGVSWCTWK